jgi:hypothetical protein
VPLKATGPALRQSNKWITAVRKRPVECQEADDDSTVLATFSAGAVFATVFRAAALFLVGAFDFFAAVARFFAAAFAPAVFLTATFPLALAFREDAAVDLVGALSAIKNRDRSLALAIHAGARPRPLHVAPDFGSLYSGGCGPLT